MGYAAVALLASNGHSRLIARRCALGGIGLGRPWPRLFLGGAANFSGRVRLFVLGRFRLLTQLRLKSRYLLLERPQSGRLTRT